MNDPLKQALHAMHHSHWVNSLNAAALLGDPSLEAPYRFDAMGWPYFIRVDSSTLLRRCPMPEEALKLAAVLTTGAERFDVVIWSHEEHKVVSIVGRNMRYEGGRDNAQRRLETAVSRTNLDKYTAEIVPAGMYEIGDRIT